MRRSGEPYRLRRQESFAGGGGAWWREREGCGYAGCGGGSKHARRQGEGDGAVRVAVGICGAAVPGEVTESCAGCGGGKLGGVRYESAQVEPELKTERRRAVRAAAAGESGSGVRSVWGGGGAGVRFSQKPFRYKLFEPQENPPGQY